MSDVVQRIKIDSAGAGGLSLGGPKWSPKQIHELALDKVSPDPENVRKVFDQTALEELAASLKSRGLLQPITVTRPDNEGRATIRHGERRWRAAKIAGFEMIRVVIDPSEGDAGRRIDQFVENEQREGLSPSEVVAFVKERLAAGMKAGELAQEIGKSKAAVSKLTALAEAPTFITERLDSVGIEAGYILMQCEKIDAARTKLFVVEAGDNIRKRDAEALQGELKGKTESFAGHGRQQNGGEPLARDDRNGGAGAKQALEEEPSSPTSLPSATSNQRAERERANSKVPVFSDEGGSARLLSDYPAIEVQGRSARFISGMVIFEGKLEAEFVDLEG